MNVRLITLLLCLLGAAVSCSTKPDVSKDAATPAESAPTLHAGVDAIPHDSLFAFASQGGVRKDIASKIYEGFANFRNIGCVLETPSYQNRRIMVTGGRPSADYIAHLADVFAASSGVANSPNSPNWAALGLSPTPNIVLYGIGLAPVLRVSLEKPELFEKALDETDKAAGFDVEKQTINGLTVRVLSEKSYKSQVENGDRMLISVAGGDLIVAHAPDGYLDSPGFLPTLLGYNDSRASAGLPESTLSYGFAPNFMGGYFSFHRLVKQMLTESSSVSGQLVYRSFSDSSNQLSQACRRALADYPIAENDTVFVASRLENDDLQVAVQWPISLSTSQSLTEALRPPVPENKKSQELLDEASTLVTDLNANVFKFLSAVGTSLDDEVDLTSQCSGKFGYTPGSLVNLIEPMKIFLEPIDALKIATASEGKKGDAAMFTVSTSEPKVLFQGLGTVLGLQVTENELSPEQLHQLQINSSFSSPFATPTYSFLGTNYFNIIFGNDYKNYLAAHEIAANETPKPTVTSTLLQMRYSGAGLLKTSSRLSKGAILDLSVDVRKSEPLHVHMKLDAAKLDLANTLFSSSWRASVNGQCK